LLRGHPADSPNFTPVTLDLSGERLAIVELPALLA
jgi:hypothetical protein